MDLCSWFHGSWVGPLIGTGPSCAEHDPWLFGLKAVITFAATFLFIHLARLPAQASLLGYILRDIRRILKQLGLRVRARSEGTFTAFNVFSGLVYFFMTALFGQSGLGYAAAWFAVVVSWELFLAPVPTDFLKCLPPTAPPDTAKVVKEELCKIGGRRAIRARVLTMELLLDALEAIFIVGAAWLFSQVVGFA